MRIQGRVDIGPYAMGSKSARGHQVFLVTMAGERYRLRRYDGPAMRDEQLEALEGQDVVADGQLHGDLVIATSLRPVATTRGPAADSPRRRKGTTHRR